MRESFKREAFEEEMKTFEEALNKAIDNDPYISGLDDGGYNDGFIDGLEHALYLIDKHKDDAVNEILEEYHEWAYNLPPSQFANWDDEEGEREKTKSRIRKEFIDYLNQKG